MALTILPNELLDKIIELVLPEGFESLALTCKKIHAVCLPFIGPHNTLRSRFHQFAYDQQKTGTVSSIVSAFDLITRIAVEPLVARYIHEADFLYDCDFLCWQPCKFNPNIHCGEAVAELLADSPSLRQASLDWQEFYNIVEKDLQAPRYSQHAAAFLLTLLPNVKEITLPNRWRFDMMSDKLIRAIVCNVQDSHHIADGNPSLARIAELKLPQTGNAFDLSQATPFLALPHVRSFHVYECDGYSPPRNLCEIQDPYGLGDSLEKVEFKHCYINDIGIAKFLKRTKHLRMLRYSHMSGSSSRLDRGGWDLCKFLTAIGRTAGHHIEALSVLMSDSCSPSVAGKLSMQGFQRLKKLELPIDIAACIRIDDVLQRTASQRMEGVNNVLTSLQEVNDAEPPLRKLVPPSVTHLALSMYGTYGDAKALKFLFRDFFPNKEHILPALEVLHLTCSTLKIDEFREQCYSLHAEAEKIGLDLQSSCDF